MIQSRLSLFSPTEQEYSLVYALLCSGYHFSQGFPWQKFTIYFKLEIDFCASAFISRVSCSL